MSPWNGAGAPPAAPGVAPRVLRMATSDGWDDEVVDRSAVFGALGVVMAPYSDWLNGGGVPAPAWVSLQPTDENLASHTGRARTSWRILDWPAWSSRKTLAAALFEPQVDALVGLGYDIHAGDEPDESRRIYPGTGARLFAREVEKQLRTAAIWLRRAPSAQPFRTARTVITVEATKQAVLVLTRQETAA